MGEIDAEYFRQQLKELADKLAKTPGDAAVLAQLKAVEKALLGLNKLEKNLQDKSFSESKRQLNDFMKEFLKELDLTKKFKSLEDKVESIETNGDQGPLRDVDPEGIKTFNSKLLAGAKGLGVWAAGFSKFSAASNKFLAGTFSAANGLGNLDGSFGDLVNKTGLSGTAFATVATILDENIDSYRNLKEASDSSIGSITQMRRAASTASLGVREFSEAIKNGTEGTKLLGGMRWAELFKNIKAQTKAQGFYGYSNEQLVKAQGEYLDILKGQGNLAQVDKDKGLTEGLDKLLKVNNKMAVILGKNREDMLAQIRTESLDASFATSQEARGLAVDQSTANYAALAGARDIAPVLADALKEGFANQGALTDERAQYVAALPEQSQKEFFKTLNAMRNGTLDTEDAATKAIQTFASETQKGMTKEYKDQFSRMGVNGDEVGKNISQTNINTKKVKQDSDIANDPNKTTDDGTAALLMAGQTMKDASMIFQDSVTGLLDSGFKNFGKDLRDMFDKGGFFEGKINAIRTYIQQFEYFGTALSVVGGVLAAGLGLSALSGAVSIVTGVFKGLGFILGGLGGTARFLGSVLSLLSKPITWAVQGIAALARGITSALPMIGNAFSWLARSVGSVAGSLGGLPGMLSKLPGILKGAGGILSGVLITNLLDGVASSVFGIGGKEIDQKKDDENWNKMGFFETIESSVARGIENVGDYIAPSVANEARASRIDAESKYFADQEKPADTKVDPVTTQSVDPAQVIPKNVQATMMERGMTKDQIDAFATQMDKSTTTTGVDQQNDIMTSLNATMAANTAALQGSTDVQQQALSPEAMQALSKATTLTDMTDTVDPTLAGPLSYMPTTDDITPRLEKSSTTLDSTAKTMDDSNIAIQNLLLQQQSTLNQIMNILKSSLDFDKENGQIMRDRLSELSKSNDDMLRVSRR